MHTPTPAELAFWCLGAFLCGSVPFGLILVKLAGKGDVRAHGSGNIGATNVSRVGGKGLGVLTLALDVLKGFAPVAFAKSQGLQADMVAGIALAAVCGHVFTPWLRFRGGKGVATALGAALGFHWLMVMPSLGLFVLLVALTRYVSLGSVVGAALMPVSLAMLPEPARPIPGAAPRIDLHDLAGTFHSVVDALDGTFRTHRTASLACWSLLALLVIVKHHENIGRLLKGTENPLWGARKGQA